jgi:SAM-dependent methyltransferase
MKLLRKDPWSRDPLGTLRKKWSVVPLAAAQRVDGKAVIDLPDDELLSMWEAAYAKEGELDRRGWYRLLYEDLVSNKKILDVGCGLAYDSLGFASRARSVTLSDIVPRNVDICRRVATMKGLTNVDYLVIRDVADIDSLDQDYDVVMAIGSLHHAPQHVIEPEVAALSRRLRPGGRWLQFAYPKTRWEREGSLAFDEWGPVTDGPGTPWTEWYDPEKLMALLPQRFELVFYTEWHGAAFNWFDLVATR